VLSLPVAPPLPQTRGGKVEPEHFYHWHAMADTVPKGYQTFKVFRTFTFNFLPLHFSKDIIKSPKISEPITRVFQGLCDYVVQGLCVGVDDAA
jgi:hypothetical protein